MASPMHQQHHQLLPLIDLDASPVQGQLSSAVLDLKGQMIRGQLNPHEAAILFQMLVEVGSLNEPSFQRLSVMVLGVRYVVARDENHVYIIQTRSSG
jgi:hypothetical protein